MNSYSTLAALLAIYTAASTANAAPRGEIVFEVALKNDKGAVYCSLFDSGDGFPSKPEKASAKTQAKPSERRARCVFSDVEAGRYAVAIWHDVDGDGKMDANFLGIPKEPVGASNGAKGSFGPPKFKDAAFDFSPPRFEQKVVVE